MVEKVGKKEEKEKAYEGEGTERNMWEEIFIFHLNPSIVERINCFYHSHLLVLHFLSLSFWYPNEGYHILSFSGLCLSFSCISFNPNILNIFIDFTTLVKEKNYSHVNCLDNWSLGPQNLKTQQPNISKDKHFLWLAKSTSPFQKSLKTQNNLLQFRISYILSHILNFAP